MALKLFQELRTKDAPVALIAQKIPGVLEALCQTGTKTKYIYISYYKSQPYTLLHNISI